MNKIFKIVGHLKKFFLRIVPRKQSNFENMRKYLIKSWKSIRSPWYKIGIIICIVLILFSLLLSLKDKSQPDYFQMRYQYTVSPYDIISGLDKSVLFDIRPANRYKLAHIVDAQNLKVVFDDNTDAIKNRKELLNQVKKAATSQTTVIIYGENEYDLKTYKVAQFVAGNGFNVKILGAGWNEFRHFSSFWLPEKVNGRVNIMDYLEGTEITRSN